MSKFKGDETILRKEGDCLSGEQIHEGQLLALLAKLERLDESVADVDEDFPAVDAVGLKFPWFGA